MKRVALSFLALAAVTVGANAADLILNDAPMTVAAPAVQDWSGFYAGVLAGYGSGSATGTSSGLSSTVTVTGPLLGATAGVNGQWDMFVLGLEGDVAWTGIGSSAPCELAPAFTCATSVGLLGTVRARAGVAVDSALLFATAGVAIGQVSGSVSPAFPGTTGALTDTHVGWTAGFGAEVGVTEDLSLKLEYAYVDLGSWVSPAGTVTPAATTTSMSFHTVKAGLNFHF